MSYLIHHAYEENREPETTCVVRSSSGDIDIPVILLANERPDLQVYIDSETGKNRHVLSLQSCQLSQAQKEALLGLHAFSGNDYIFLLCAKERKHFGT